MFNMLNFVSVYTNFIKINKSVNNMFYNKTKQNMHKWVSHVISFYHILEIFDVDLFVLFFLQIKQSLFKGQLSFKSE